MRLSSHWADLPKWVFIIQWPNGGDVAMERSTKVVVIICFALVVSSSIVLGYNYGYQEKDIAVTVVKKWIEDGRMYFNTTDDRMYELSNSCWLGLFDCDGRYNIIQEGRCYIIDTMGGRLNYSIFRPNAYNIREVGLDSSKP